MMRIVLCVLLVGLAGPAAAQVYKCPGPGGGWQYQDQPCAGGRPVDIRPEPPRESVYERMLRDQRRQQRIEMEYDTRRYEASAAAREYREAEEARLKEAKRRRCGRPGNHDLDCLRD